MDEYEWIDNEEAARILRLERSHFRSLHRRSGNSLTVGQIVEHGWKPKFYRRDEMEAIAHIAAQAHIPRTSAAKVMAAYRDGRLDLLRYLPEGSGKV